MNQKTGIAIAVGALAVLFLTRKKLTATVQTFEFYDTDQYLPGSTSYPDAIKTFAQAIAHAEGFGVPGAIPTIANNPGDIKVPDWGGQKIAGGISVFESVDDGWARLYRQLALILSGQSKHYNLDMTIADMGMTYAGGDSNWAENVAAYLGVDSSAPLWQVIA